MRAERTDELVQHVEQILLQGPSAPRLRGMEWRIITCSLCISKPMNVMKSISSVGSK